MGKEQAKKKKPLFQMDLGINLEMDFDPEDFDLLEDPEKQAEPKGERQRDVRILRPRGDSDPLADVREC